MDDSKKRPLPPGPRYAPRPRRPDLGSTAERKTPRARRSDFDAFAIVLEDRVVLRTPFDQALVDALKQVPAPLRAFVKDGRPLERHLREHLEANADYFSSDDQLATSVAQLVDCIAAAGGLSDSWAVSLASSEIFDWALGSALRSFPDLHLFDVRILEEKPGGC
jgi:hypothetical protein